MMNVNCCFGNETTPPLAGDTRTEDELFRDLAQLLYDAEQFGKPELNARLREFRHIHVPNLAIQHARFVSYCAFINDQTKGTK